jgi:hypothetical protein
MTEDQKKWLSENPPYSPVRHGQVVSLKGWTDKGYLFDSGRFVKDDGQTLFWNVKAMLVGREYDIV